MSVFVSLAMVLRGRPSVFADVFPNLRGLHYQGPDKLPFIVWMMGQVRSYQEYQSFFLLSVICVLKVIEL